MLLHQTQLLADMNLRERLRHLRRRIRIRIHEIRETEIVMTNHRNRTGRATHVHLPSPGIVAEAYQAHTKSLHPNPQTACS